MKGVGYEGIGEGEWKSLRRYLGDRIDLISKGEYRWKT
jgi:hypothetical protein